MVLYGSVTAGTTASSAFTLRASDRPLLVGVSSHATLGWFVSFAVTPDGPFIRYCDMLNSTGSYALFWGAGGGWGVIPYPPTGTLRLETTGAAAAVTSFTLIELAGGR
jgi:hypothetical protein